MSGVWKHFRKQGDEAQCKECPKKLKYAGGSTSGLIRHLQSIHKININSSTTPIDPNNNNSLKGDFVPKSNSRNETAENPKTSNSISNYMNKKTLQEIVSRLAAVDGMSIRCITNSTFIRESFASKNMKLPKCETLVKSLIMKYYESVKEITAKKISLQISNNERFSLTLDEWTCVTQKRYLNVCLTGKNSFYNLGLVFISGRCNAIEIRKMVENRLQEFNLSFEHHIVATVSDGPNVMKRFVSDSPIEGYFCWNHAIHLAVLEVLYVKRDTSVSGSESEYSSDEAEGGKFDIMENYGKAIQCVRKFVMMFKKSPLKTSCLEKYVKQEFGKEIQLIYDIKTRWNSMVGMIESFLKIKNAIKKTLIDIDCGHLWNEEYVKVLKMLVEVLNPIKDAVEALSRRDTNILVADAIMTTLYEQLSSVDTSLSRQMLESIKTKVNDRRCEKLIITMNYLKSNKS